MTSYTEFTDATPYLGGESRSNYDPLLRDVFAPRLERHVHTDVMIMSIIGKRMGRMGGKKLVSAVTTSLPQSVAAVLEGAPLPEPKKGTHTNPLLLARNIYGRYRETGNVGRAARMGKRAAWAGPKKKNLQDLVLQYELTVSRMCYLGPYDALGPIQSYAGPTVTLYGRNARSSQPADFYKMGLHFVRDDYDIGIVPNDTAVVDLDGGHLVPAGGLTDANYQSAILTTSNLDESAPGSPTFDLASTTPLGASILNRDPLQAEDLIIPFNSRAATIAGSPAQEGSFAGFNGLANMITDDSIYPVLHGLDKSTFPSFQGRYLTNGGTQRPYSEMLLTLLIDRIYDEGTNRGPDCLVTGRAIRREVVAEHEGDRRFGPVQSERGFAMLQHTAGDKPLPFKVDNWAFPGMVAALRSQTFGWYSESDLNYMPDRFVPNYDMGERWFHKSGNIECTTPFDNGMLDDLTYDVYALTGA